MTFQIKKFGEIKIGTMFKFMNCMFIKTELCHLADDDAPRVNCCNTGNGKMGYLKSEQLVEALCE